MPLLQSIPGLQSELMSLHENTSDEQLLPSLTERSADGSEHTEDSGDEDCSTAAEVVVARVTDPAADQRAPDVWASVDEANKQVVVPTVGTAFCITFANTKLDREGQICSIGPSLVPIPHL